VELELKFLFRYGVGVELEWLTLGVAHLCQKNMLTSFSRKALASAFAPSSPMPFSPRLNVVSAYARKLKI
jgi:hypothetical protein